MGAVLLWIGALSLYLPQIMWAPPGVLLATFLFKYDRRRNWLPPAPAAQGSWMRIDHIMVNAGLATRRCRAGSAEAPDHRPVLADLVLK